MDWKRHEDNEKTRCRKLTATGTNQIPRTDVPRRTESRNIDGKALPPHAEEVQAAVAQAQQEAPPDPFADDWAVYSSSQLSQTS